VVADKGYYDGAEVAACAAAGISAYIAKPNNSSKSLKAGRFGKPDFTYDAPRMIATAVLRESG
jgi:hypothetical protein